MPKLENWFIVNGNISNLTEDEQPFFLQGLVYGHDKFYDGKLIITSSVIDLNIEDRFANTASGTNYILGKPDMGWIKWLEDNSYTDYIDELKNIPSIFLN